MAKKSPEEKKPIPKLTTTEVTNALVTSVDPREFGLFLEVSTVSGKKLDQGVRRMDAWSVRYWGDNETHCYEVKVSKSDFMHEIKTPLKRKDGFRLSNRYSFVAPEGMIDLNLLPYDAGLIEVSEDLSVKTVVKAPWRDAYFLPRNFLAVLMRRIDKDRLYSYLRTLGNDEFSMEVSAVALEILDSHTEKWVDFSHGDKTVPDRIAKALSDVKNDVLTELVKRKIYK